MKTILLSTFIIICLGAPSLMANVLVENCLQATAREYAWNSHTDSAAKEISFSVPGAGFLRITYTDASYNREASDRGLSWRRVPGATNYWKAPGTGIKSLKEPDPPVSGTQLKFTNITRVDGPMHNVGVVLTPRFRVTWSGGGYQYHSDLHVQVEWSPREFQLKQGAKITNNGRNTQVESGNDIKPPVTVTTLSGTWTAYIPAKNWSHGGYQIIQNGQDLIYVVYSGERHTGRVLSEGTISYVEANETGKVSRNGKRINWSNGTYWTKDSE